ncbi:MAG TPA: kelch repeat-containing protein [Chthoniobacterales bacterium]
MKSSIRPVRTAPATSRAKRTGILLLFAAAVTLCGARPTRADDAGALIHPRYFHTATLLTDGRVLLAGGLIQGGLVTDACEIYDPATNSEA